MTIITIHVEEKKQLLLTSADSKLRRGREAPWFFVSTQSCLLILPPNPAVFSAEPCKNRHYHRLACQSPVIPNSLELQTLGDLLLKVHHFIEQVLELQVVGINFLLGLKGR